MSRTEFEGTEDSGEFMVTEPIPFMDDENFSHRLDEASEDDIRAWLVSLGMEESKIQDVLDSIKKDQP